MKKEIQIPFEGLYNSVIDSMIDDYILQLFDFEGYQDSDLIPEKFYYYFGYNDAMLKALAQEYTERFQDYLENEFDIKISLKFKEITSPKFYNFETDKIFCEISEKDCIKLRKLTKLPDNRILRKVIKERHSSRSGFISFYPDDYDDPQWRRCSKLYDHNQLETLLIAAMLSQMEKGKCCLSSDGYRYFQENYIPSAFDIWEDINGNGELDTIVFNNMAQECQDMANQAYENYQKEQA